MQKVRKDALNCAVFVKKTTFPCKSWQFAATIFMQVQKKYLTNYSNEYKLRAKVIQMHNNFAVGREECGCGDARWEDAYLWPCAHGGLTVCADCFDTLVGGLSRRELAARLSAPGT